MKVIHIDFETRSRCDLKSAGSHRYAQDPSTEILCVAWAVGDEDPDIWFPTTEPFDLSEPAIRLYQFAGDQNIHFAAFNASFESSIWSEIMDVDGFPSIASRRWHCTASQGYALSYPRSLEAMSKALGLEQEKDSEGAKLMRKMCVIKGDTMPEIDPEELIRLGEYCKQDVIVEREIARKLPPLSAHEQKIYVADQKINKRGVEVDVTRTQNAVRMVAECTKAANAELVRVTGGAVRTVGQTAVIKKFAEDRGATMEDCTADTLKALLKDPELDPLTRKVFELRLSANRAAAKKYPAILKAVCEDGKVRDHLMYCGAPRTRRWSGQRTQTQNIARGYAKPHDIGAGCAVLKSCDVELANIFFGDAMEMLCGLVRSMFRAAEGCRFLTVDFSGIEARVLAMVTGNASMLKDFERKRDPYITMGAAIYGVKYEDIAPEGDKRRFFGKQAILGLGYGMGWEKFQATCEKYGEIITEDFARKVVEIYREKNAIVCDFWGQIETDFFNVIKTKKPISREFYSLRWEECLNALVLTLPNGSDRWYVEAEIKHRKKWGKIKPAITYTGVNSNTGKWERQETYGGKITENFIQGIARELQADAVLAVEGAGLPIVLHAHDEIVCEVPYNSRGSLEELINLMTTASAWASSWPIGASGWEGPRYKK